MEESTLNEDEELLEIPIMSTSQPQSTVTIRLSVPHTQIYALKKWRKKSR